MIIDAFIFFNEKELVELRVKYLNSIVDYFVIVEADITHQGKKKDWNFPKILENNLKDFSNKIQYHHPNLLQGTWRFLNRDNREDLHNLYNPIIKAISWYLNDNSLEDFSDSLDNSDNSDNSSDISVEDYSDNSEEGNKIMIIITTIMTIMAI